MKARIIGTIIVLAILGGLYAVLSDDSPKAPPQQMQSVSPGDSSFKDLKIN